MGVFRSIFRGSPQLVFADERNANDEWDYLTHITLITKTEPRVRRGPKLIQGYMPRLRKHNKK